MELPKKKKSVSFEVLEEVKTGDEEYMYMLYEYDGKIRMCGIFKTLEKAQKFYEECTENEGLLNWIEDEDIPDAVTAKGYGPNDEVRMYIVKMEIGGMSSEYLEY